MQWTSSPTFHCLQTEMTMAIQPKPTLRQPPPHKSSKAFLWPTENWTGIALYWATNQSNRCLSELRLFLQPTTLSLFICRLLIQESTLAEFNQHVSGTCIVVFVFCFCFLSKQAHSHFEKWLCVEIDIYIYIYLYLHENMVDMVRLLGYEFGLHHLEYCKHSFCRSRQIEPYPHKQSI